MSVYSRPISIPPPCSFHCRSHTVDSSSSPLIIEYSIQFSQPRSNRDEMDTHKSLNSPHLCCCWWWRSLITRHQHKTHKPYSKGSLKSFVFWLFFLFSPLNIIAVMRFCFVYCIRYIHKTSGWSWIWGIRCCSLDVPYTHLLPTLYTSMSQGES